jgi:outer membrane protein
MFKNLKVLGVCLSAACIFFAGQSHAAAEVKIGVVDVPKAIQATKEGQKIKKELEEDYNKRKADLEKKAKDIQQMQTDFEKKSLVLSDEARQKKGQAIEEEKMHYMEARDKNLEDLRKKDHDLSQPMIKKLNDVISEIATKESYTAIFHKNDQNLVWTSPDIDITDKVIKALEKK